MAIQRTTVQKIAKRRGPNHPTEPSHPVFFIPRERMKARALLQRLRITVPPTTLPVDCSGGATVQCPMDGNDQYGDCGEAMCAHGDNLMTFGNGKRTQSSFDTGALVNQYLAISGGDNGMDESMVVGSSGVWKVGLAGNAQAVVQDALDIPGDAATLQYFIDQFWAVYMA
ncbi:MAG TPA: hypothetical protein VKT72_07335, partial [Candidatus Baltobacteraceae bacterium]|nr:hypothetical protein [Candidatus Baltobacteraceae bacterium]